MPLVGVVHEPPLLLAVHFRLAVAGVHPSVAVGAENDILARAEVDAYARLVEHAVDRTPHGRGRCDAGIGDGCLCPELIRPNVTIADVAQEPALISG